MYAYTTVVLLSSCVLQGADKHSSTLHRIQEKRQKNKRVYSKKKAEEEEEGIDEQAGGDCSSAVPVLVRLDSCLP